MFSQKCAVDMTCHKMVDRGLQKTEMLHVYFEVQCKYAFSLGGFWMLTAAHYMYNCMYMSVYMYRVGTRIFQSGSWDPHILPNKGPYHLLWVPIICHPVVNVFFPVLNNSYKSLINRLWYLWSVASEIPSAIYQNNCYVHYPVALYQPKNIPTCIHLNTQHEKSLQNGGCLCKCPSLF